MFNDSAFVVVAKCCFGHLLSVICEFAKTLGTSDGKINSS